MKVKLIVNLDIDTEDEEELQGIIQEMHYNFSYTRLNGLYNEEELIKDTEIIDYKILAYE